MTRTWSKSSRSCGSPSLAREEVADDSETSRLLNQGGRRHLEGSCVADRSVGVPGTRMASRPCKIDSDESRASEDASRAVSANRPAAVAVDHGRAQPTAGLVAVSHLRGNENSMSSASQLGRNRPLVLVVMDGIGVGKGDAFDAVALAHTPNLDQLASESSRTLKAHGTAVGLPSDADMGNSEVGHNILGAGRIFDQGAKRVDNASRPVRSGSPTHGNGLWTAVGAVAGRCT